MVDFKRQRGDKRRRPCFCPYHTYLHSSVLSFVSMGNVNTEEADALDILGMRISCDARWRRVFHCSFGTIMKALISDNHIFLRSTRNSRRALPFVVDCAMHYRENLFFACTARLWNDLSAEVFLVGYDIGKFKLNVRKHYSLFPAQCTA